MKRTHRIKISTIRRQRLTASLPLVRAHCPMCEHEVTTLSAAQATAILEIDQLTLDAFIAAGRLHVLTTVSGSRRICQNSLFPEGVKNDLA